MLKKIKTYIENEPWDVNMFRHDREWQRWCLTFLAFVMFYFSLEVIIRIFQL